MACIYILKSEETGKYYTGASRENNAEKRLRYHNGGKNKSTKAGRPWALVYVEGQGTFQEARVRENYLKTGQGRQWIKSEGWQSGRMRRSCPPRKAADPPVCWAEKP